VRKVWISDGAEIHLKTIYQKITYINLES
jgi:hypothetical protein